MKPCRRCCFSCVSTKVRAQREPIHVATLDPIPSPSSSAEPTQVVRSTRPDGSLDPAFRAALDIGADLLEHTVRARLLSARMVFLQRKEEAIGFHTSSIGEEAAIVGAALAARKD